MYIYIYVLYILYYIYVIYIYIYVKGSYTKGVADDESKFLKNLLIKIILPINDYNTYIYLDTIKFN